MALPRGSSFDFVHTVIKLPAHWEIEREWSGIMGFTETKSPSIEKIGSKTWQVAGLSGMGIALGMALGKKAAERFLQKFHFLLAPLQENLSVHHV